MKRFIVAVSIPLIAILSPARLMAAAQPSIGTIQASGATADDEFVEIVNGGDEAADIGAWSLQYKSAAGAAFYKKNFAKGTSVAAGGTYVACGKGFAGACDMKHSSFSLSSAGGTVFLVSNQALLTSADSPAVVDKKTHEADAPAADAAADETPAAEQSASAAAAETPSAGASTNLSVTVNEIMPDPEDGDEWIEIHNGSGYAIDLAGWTLADGTGRECASLSGLIMPNAQLKATLPAPKLNDDGDLVILRDASRREVDSVAYGSWDDGIGNAPAAGRGIAIARIGDGRDTGDDLSDFALTSEPTPGAPNVIVAPPAAATAARAAAKAATKKSAAKAQPRADIDKLVALLEGKDKIFIIENLYINADAGGGAKISAATVASKPAAKTASAKAAPAKAAAWAEGQVIVPPGIVGKDICVVREADRSVEVRLPAGIAAAPAAGDLIRASGSWSQAATLTLPRLLVKSAAAFAVTGRSDPPAPLPIPLSAAKDHIGEIVEIDAPIAEKQPTRFRLADGGASALIKSPFEAAVGDRVAAQGLLAQSGADLILTPLAPDGIRLIKPPPSPPPSLARKALPYGLATVPAGLLTAAAYAGKRLKRKKGGEGP